MANIFKQQLDVNQHPNRSNFDLTHKVHGSYKPGVLYPFLTKYVVPTDTFEIDTAVGMQCMPMPFPTQSNIRIEFYYFYQRLKNCWPNFENWIEMLEDHVPPFIDQPIQFYKTGSLADFLDIPTTFVSSSDLSLSSNYRFWLALNMDVSSGLFFEPHPVDDYSPIDDGVKSIAFIPDTDVKPISYLSDHPGILPSITIYTPIFVTEYYESFNVVPQLQIFLCHETGSTFKVDTRLISASQIRLNPSVSSIDVQLTETQMNFWNQAANLPNYRLLFMFSVASESFNRNILPSPYDHMYSVPVSENSVLDLPSLPQVQSPYYYSGLDYPIGSDPNVVRVSALPFRTYESIFNAFFRNTVVQPFMINGQKVYNRYNTTLEDGADITDYRLFTKNWELDAYTSCLPSPQQGNAPLVGMNALGQVTIEDENGITTAQYSVDDGVGKVVVTSPLASSDHGRVLMDLAQSGISINDFRSVNALQRLLEQTLRSGYKYVDFIKGHFGSAPKHSVMDMPEFIGGFSQRLDVNMISNTNGVVPTDSEQVLGSFAGQGRFFGSSKHKIKHYFDDYGIVMGIMCIVPDAAYSQLLPKHFTYNKPLDFYFPEFSQLGMQPLTYEELCPVQSHLEGKKLTDTFGYQRPNHEYVWYPDTLHGQFRTTLKDYVVNRIFDKRPELGNEFLKIDPSDVDHIFAVTEADNDTFVGQIVVGIHAKRPIPRIVIPGLGR